MLFFFVLGIIAGYFAAFLGIGAGVIMMPFLIFFGVPYIPAISVSLLSVFLSSISSTLQNWNKKIFDKSIYPIYISGAIFSLAGTYYFINIISTDILKLIFSGILFVNIDIVRIFMTKKINRVLVTKLTSGLNPIWFIVIGSMSGLSASLLGIGGGIFAVPLLISLCRHDVKYAVQVSIAMMVVTTFFAQFRTIVELNIPLSVGIPLAFGAVIGSFFGGFAFKYINKIDIIYLNNWASFFMGSLMLYNVII